MEESNVPIALGYWLLALAPIVVLLVLLAVLRWKAPQAGPVGLFAGIVVALVAFRAPWETTAVGAAKGVWDAVFILLVIWPALLLYRVTDAAGAFDALRRGISRFSRNDLFLVLAFGWVFASFLQGIAGFGTPIAVVAPLLLALGVRPVYAVVVPLIGHAWANMFGTLAVGWLATIQVVDLEDLDETAFQSALLLWIPNITAGLFIAWMVGRARGLRAAWPMVLVVTIVHGAGQLALSAWDPVLSNFLPTTAALLLLYPLSRWSRYREPDEELDASRVMAEDRADPDADDDEPLMGLGMAIAPYVVLTVVTVFVLVTPPVEDALETVEIGIPFPEVSTGYDVVNEAEDPYDPITPLTHPGAFLLVATLAAFLLYRARGYYGRWKERATPEPIGSALVGDAVPASVAVVSFLVLSKVMAHSGQTESLALGIAEVAPPAVYTFAAGFIGVLGAFMTSSNTASNVLFAPLQQTVATSEGISEATIIAAQSNGGAIGNAVAPANIVLGTGAVGAVGQEGAVLRKTLPWAMVVTVLSGFAAVVLDGMELL